jgi:ketosteroid isomerase-like protein
MANQNVEIIKAGYAAFNAADPEATMAVFDDNIVWISTGNSVISGTFTGKAELAVLLQRLVGEQTSVAPKEFFADGDVVVALTEVTAGGQTSQEAEVWTLQDGKIVKGQIFGDTAMQEKIFGTK